MKHNKAIIDGKEQPAYAILLKVDCVCFFNGHDNNNYRWIEEVVVRCIKTVCGYIFLAVQYMFEDNAVRVFKWIL